MSAVPKKKLCWNCEGNVAQSTDNCPYCGVYIQGTDFESEKLWNPSYSPPNPTELNQEIPQPLYQIHPLETPEPELIEEQKEASASEKSSTTNMPIIILAQLRKDIFPFLFLMSGSVFFLFSMILFLFSHEGVLTLQWNGNNWFYFLFLSVPLLYYGWKCLQDIEGN